MYKYRKCFQMHSRHLVQQCRTGDHIHYKMFLVKWECIYIFPHKPIVHPSQFSLRPGIR
jgi:hypothetical protein